MIKKRITSLLLCVLLIIPVLPERVLAADTGDFSVEGNPSGYQYNTNTLTFTQPGEYTVSMASGVVSTTTDKIVVNSLTTGAAIEITLNNVYIDRSASNGCAFEIQGNSVVDLTLEVGSTNCLKSGVNYAGLQVPQGSILTIDGEGTLEASATGASLGSGIGALASSSSGDIIINSGTIVASSDQGAGIGSSGGAAAVGGEVTINGGNVTASSTTGAGIGSGFDSSGGLVNITGGIVNASSTWGAGIGSGWLAEDTIVSITGGIVNANSSEGAGIGSGFDSQGNQVNIEGGTVTAISENGAGIGNGYAFLNHEFVYISGGSINAHSSNNLKVSSDYLQNNSTDADNVCLTTITLTDSFGANIGKQLITELNIQFENLGYAYGLKDVQTDTNGKLYLYLPADSSTLIAKTTDGIYSGKAMTTTNEATSIGTLSQFKVVSATPQGSDALVDDNIIIHFSKQMDTATVGSVLLDALAGSASLDVDLGTWTDNKTFTVPYSGLSYDTEYTINISGFKDQDGNNMIQDNVNHFTTKEEPKSPSVSLNSISIARGSTDHFNISLGQGSKGASTATISVADTNIVSVSQTAINTSGDITVNGLSAGHTEIRITFNDPDNTVITLQATITSSSSGSSKRTETNENRQIILGISGKNIQLDINKNDNEASVNLDRETINRLFQDIEIDKGATSKIEIVVPEIKGVNTYLLELPIDALTLETASREIELITKKGTITIPSNMLIGLGLEDTQTVGVTIGEGDKSQLPDEVKETIGDRPLIQLYLTADGEKMEWYNPNASVTVSIPYSPTEYELENFEHITVWYIDGSGRVVEVPSGRYNPETGMLTFETNHFSYYAIVFIQKEYNDLSNVIWAKDQIEILCSKGIMRGMSEKEFKPNESITRADFLYALIRTLNVQADANDNFKDISNEAYYYDELAIAKKLGIAQGTGDNHFNPEGYICRQDMMVLTERALRKLHRLESPGTITALNRFADISLIANYAVSSIDNLVREGFIKGSGEYINPLSYSTRAEAGVFLYRIYNQ